MEIELDGLFDKIESAIADFELKNNIMIFPNRLRLAIHIEEYLKDKLKGVSK